MNNIFDLVVLGGGHAGVEAVLAGKRMGHNVALITLDKTKTGRMSCNPAIGGIGKTHLAKEIDALGGYMAEATDLSGIQFRTLNKKKGPAVQATRAQADKELYEKTIQAKLEKEQIDVFEDEVIDFEEKNGEIFAAVGKNNTPSLLNSFCRYCKLFLFVLIVLLRKSKSSKAAHPAICAGIEGSKGTLTFIKFDIKSWCANP